jgi:hypothetical protein
MTNHHNHGDKEECHECKLKREAFNDGLEFAAQLVHRSNAQQLPLLPTAIRGYKRIRP